MSRDLPSVTQVLGLFADFSMIPEATLAAAADRGTRVHAFCAGIAQGLWGKVDEDCAGYVRSFQGWLDLAVESVIGVELEVIHPGHGYKGHLDLAVKMKGDADITIIDLKTPAAKNRLWSAQLEAYRVAFNDQNPSQASKVASLRLRADGGPARFDPYYTGVQDFTAFLSALNAYRWFKS